MAAYRRKCPDGWHVDPPNDGYYFTHLRHHLIAAGRASELAQLLHELRWLEAKNEVGLTFDLTADFADVMKGLPETDARLRNLRLLDEALRRDIHFIARHAKDYPQGLFQCLWNNCWWYDAPEAAAHYDLTGAGRRRTVAGFATGKNGWRCSWGSVLGKGTCNEMLHVVTLAKAPGDSLGNGSEGQKRAGTRIRCTA